MRSQAVELRVGNAKSEYMPPVHKGMLMQAMFWMQDHRVDMVKHQQILKVQVNYEQNAS